jgi:hypothetical protein
MVVYLSFHRRLEEVLLAAVEIASGYEAAR